MHIYAKVYTSQKSYKMANKDLYFWGLLLILLYYFNCCWSQNIQFHLDAGAEKERKKKISTQKYPAVNFVLRKILAATKMEWMNTQQTSTKKKLNTKSTKKKNSLIKYGCRPTFFFSFSKYIYVCINNQHTFFFFFMKSRFWA